MVLGYVIAVIGDAAYGQAFSGIMAQTSFLVIPRHTYFQIVTSIFVTDSAVDVIFNALAVIILDVFLDPSFNHTRYFGIFFLSAVSGNLLTLVLGPLFSIYSSAGASGGIFGLYAATFAYKWAEEKQIDRGTLLLFGAIFAGSLAFQNVNWVAHLGGSIGGFIAGPVLFIALKYRLANYQSVSDSSGPTKVVVWGLILAVLIGSVLQFFLFATQ